MSRKAIIKKHIVIDNVDSTTDPESKHTSFAMIDKGMYFVEVEASVTGDLNVQYCDDQEITSNSVWQNLDFGGSVGESIPISGAANTEIEINLREISHSFLRLKFTDNAGSGNISAYVYAQSVGV